MLIFSLFTPSFHENKPLLLLKPLLIYVYLCASRSTIIHLLSVHWMRRTPSQCTPDIFHVRSFVMCLTKMCMYVKLSTQCAHFAQIKCEKSSDVKESKQKPPKCTMQCKEIACRMICAKVNMCVLLQTENEMTKRETTRSIMTQKSDKSLEFISLFGGF